MSDSAVLMQQKIFERTAEMGLDQDLASLSGLSDERLGAIRSGESASSSEFELICRALAVDPGSMYTGAASSPARSPARFRAATALATPNPQDVRLLALAAEQGRILGHLMVVLGLEVNLRSHRDIRGFGRGSDPWRDGYDLGEAARQAIAPGGAPLPDLPNLLRECGIHVARVPMSSREIDGASIWETDAVPVVLLNSRSHVVEHPGAYRASLAHELCHLLHDSGERNLTTQVSWGTEGEGNYHDDLEKRARAFAPAFLAPREHVKGWHSKLPKRITENPVELARALAETWGLSFEGAAWHAKNSGLIGSSEADRLAEMPRKPLISLVNFEIKEDIYPPAMFHSGLPDTAAPLWQGWASVLVLKALEEGCISVGRARELLTWS